MLSELQKTIINYPQEEKEYMMEMNKKFSKVDLLLQLNHFNNLHKMELEKLTSKSNKIKDLARKLMDESEYYYQLKKQGNSPEYIFEKAQEEAEEIMMKEFIEMLKKENK